MAKATAVAAPEKQKEKPSASFRFPKDSKMQPEGLKSMSVDDEVTVTVKGRVSSYSDRSDPWDAGKSLSLEISSCTVETKPKGTGMDEALEAARQQQTWE